MSKTVRMIFFYPFRILIILIFLILLCMSVFIFVNSVLNMYRINYVGLNNSLNSLLDKTINLSMKSESFSEEKSLQSLTPNSYNQFYYRFDDQLKVAHYSYKKSHHINSRQQTNDINFDFNDQADLILKPSKGDFLVENGILKYEHNKSNILQNDQELNIQRGAIGEVLIRMKNNKSKKILLAWSNETDIDVFNPYQNDYLAFWTIPDGQFHTYSVNVQNVLKGFSNSDALIKTISIFPLNVPKENIEIDYIKFISKQSKYSQLQYGIEYESINSEMRKIIYMNSPFALSYSLNLPSKESLFLNFGVSKLNDDVPVTFKVNVECDGHSEIIFSKSIDTNQAWQDFNIDMTSFSGKKAKINFEAISEKENIAFWSNPFLYSPPEKRFNVIIILEDALRADYVSCYDYMQNITPEKDQWAKKGIIFENAYSQATHTRASCSSFMTSLYPGATGVWNSGETLHDGYLTLGEIMRYQGFKSAMFTQNVNSGPNVGLHQGFSEIYDGEIAGQRAQDIYQGESLKEWIRENKTRNFFLYLHILDPHGPYDPPEHFASRYRRPYIGGKNEVLHQKTLDPSWLKRPTVESRHFLYSEEVKYNDSQFEYFINLLKKNDLLENTLIIFISDHGEHLGEHDIWSHVPPGNKQVLHVPLIMVYPEKLPAGIKITQPVQLLDMMPTILDLAGIDKNNLLIQGESLLPLIVKDDSDSFNDRFVFSEEVKFKTKEDVNAFGSIFFENWHLINSENLNDSLSKEIKHYNKNLYDNFFTTRVYNMDKDNSEQIESINFLIDFYLHHKIQKYMNELRQENKQIWSALTKNEHRETKYDPSTIEQLRSLGYVE